MKKVLLLSLLLMSCVQLSAQPNSWSEFMGGQRGSYSTNGNPKTKGLELSFEYPSSWEGADGKRPNTLYQIASEHGKGLDICNLGVKDIPVAPGQSFSKSDIYELFDPADLSWFLPGGATLVAGKRTTIDGQPAAQVQFTQEVDRAGIPYQMMGVMYPIYFRNKFIIFTCMSGDSAATSSEQLRGRYRVAFPLFQQLANTLVIHSKWK